MNKNVIKAMSLTTGIALLTTNTVFAQGEIKKEEAVYINLNAKGTVVDTTVSDWLHSDNGFTDFKDITVLSNITNVKSDDVPSISGTEAIWNSKNTDIFYQGKTDKALPLTFNISYKLDGVEIDPKDIGSKSGNVEIKLQITNNDKHDVTINGENKTLYTPFLTAAVVSLSMDKFKNVTTNSGEMISDGNNNIITFATIPGLKESLNIEDEDIKIPEELIINAEVTNFSLPSIMITSTSSIPSIDKIDSASSIDELQDGLEDLSSASSKILDGIGTLSDGSLDLNTGIESLSSGVTDLYGGSTKLKDGTNSLYKGLDSALTGSTNLNTGINSLKDGSSILSEKSVELYTGSNNLNNGLLGLQAGFSKLVEGGANLKEGTTSVKNGYATQMSYYENLTKSLEQILSTMEDSNPYKDSLSKVLAGLKGTNAASTNITTGIATIEGGLTNLNTGLNTSKAGIDGLAAGSTSLKDGASKISSGIKSLDDGLLAASNGGKELNNGINSLYKGSAALNTGSLDLNSGLLKAKNGTETLKEGSNKIYNGTVELKTNYEKFHNDGILALSDKLNDKIDDLNLLLDEKDELVKLSNNYNVFSGDSQNVEGNTKFIFKTEEIKGSKEVTPEKKVEVPESTTSEKKSGFFSWIVGIFKK